MPRHCGRGSGQASGHRDHETRKPVAKLVPVEKENNDIFGFFKGKIEVKGDIVAPALTPEEWGDLYFDPAPETFEKKKS